MTRFTDRGIHLMLLVAFTLLSLQPLKQAQANEAWPKAEVFASHLANPATRTDSLQRLAVALRLQQRLLDGEDPLPPDAAAQERAWLEQLRNRYGPVDARPPVLDPSLWRVFLKLSRQQLSPGRLLAPNGLDLGSYLSAVFQRDDERMAAAALPVLLWQLEAESMALWFRLDEQAAVNASLSAGLSPWVQAWLGQGSESSDDAKPAAGQARVDARQMLTMLKQDAVSAGPPDPRRLEQLRFELLLQLAEGGEPPSAEVVSYLRLAGMLDGLHTHRYIAFAEGLLAVAGSLLTERDQDIMPVAAWLTAHLPDLSNGYARAFAEVDPRINSAVAAVFDVARNLAAGKEGLALEPLISELADAVAQISLQVTDLDYYFGLPVRDTIAGTVDACIGIVARNDSDGRPGMTRELFDDCQDSLVRLADTESRTPGLAGDPGGPFGRQQLRREVSVTSAQRMNYGLGYLHQRYETACALPDRPLPNPLEWSTLANLLAWFADQSPVYFQTPENESRLLRMRAIGRDLADTLAGQVDCFAGSGAGLNDPVTRSLADYETALLGLNASLRESILNYREQALAPGADIALEADASQETTYRPDDVLIGPCDAEQICEMSGSLSATRALLGLFPESYLVADQSGLGEIQLCYDNMEWVNRRAEPVRPGDTNVANYFGRFAFDLKGRFLANEEALEVFGFRFTSPDEYHYLFAAASEEVLADACPVEWVGSRIVTPMEKSRGGIVPDRLTYLAAPRMLPSRLLSLNWDRGAEWRDWFITGIGVAPIPPESPPDISASVTNHLQLLYRREQAFVYQRLLYGDDADSLASAYQRLEDLSTQKGLVRMLIMLFYPRAMLDSDEVRSALTGQAGLLDATLINRFRQDNMPVSAVGELGQRRLRSLRAAWRTQPEAGLRTGSIPREVVFALLRLDRIYQDYFAARPESDGPGEISPSGPADD